MPAPYCRGWSPCPVSGMTWAQPHQAAVFVQFRHLELFHVKHLDVCRHCGALIGRQVGLHGGPLPSWRQELTGQAREVVDRGEGARGDQVELGLLERARRLDPAVDAVQVRQAELGRGLPDERRLLGDGVDAGHLPGRIQHREDHARQAGAAAHVQDAQRALPGCAGALAKRRDHREAVQQVVREHLAGVADGGEVVDLGPALDHGHVGQQPLALRGGHAQAQVEAPAPRVGRPGGTGHRIQAACSAGAVGSRSP